MPQKFYFFTKVELIYNFSGGANHSTSSVKSKIPEGLLALPYPFLYSHLAAEDIS